MTKQMKVLKIVLASSDGIKLTSKHFGDAGKYYFYKILENGLIELDCFIENKFKNTNERTAHGSKQKRQSIISSFGEKIDFIITNKISPNFNKINTKTKVCPIVSEISNISDCLDYLKSNIGDIFEIKKLKL